MLTAASQVCPNLHIQFFFWPEPAVTVEGSHPYASAAILGNLVFRSLNPTRSCLLEHIGHPWLLVVRLFSVASQVCPRLHIQLFFWPEPGAIFEGSHPFASAAIFGNLVWRSLNPTDICWLEHMRHPVFWNVRLTISASQVCPNLHIQFFFRCEPATTVEGSHPYASAAIAGNLVCRSLNPTNICWLEHIGHPRLLDVRLLTLLSQVCPKLHIQLFFWCEPAITVAGSHPFASTAISGNLVLRSLNPVWTCLLEHLGHPVFLDVLLFSVASQVCSNLHIQLFFVFEPAMIIVGSHPFASAAISGNLVCRSLNPANICWLEHIGHPLFRDVRLFTVASQVCPKLHIQLFFLFEPGIIFTGSHPFASAAISGNLVCRSLNPANICWLAHTGHPALCNVLLLIVASQVCPNLHIQFFFWPEPPAIVEGSQPFASTAISGNLVWRSLIPRIGLDEDI